MLKVKVKEGVLTEAQVSCFFIIDRDFLSTVDPWTTQRLEAPTLLPVEYPCITLILYIHCSSVSKVPSNGRLCRTAQSVFLFLKKIFFWTVVFLLKKFCVVFTTKKKILWISGPTHFKPVLFKGPNVFTGWTAY